MGRRAGAALHRPDGSPPAVQNFTKKSIEMTKVRAIRAQVAPRPQGAPSAADSRVDFVAKGVPDKKRPAGLVHRPDSPIPTVTDKSAEVIRSRAVRARKGPSAEKRGQ
jgi:hypothetical protein